MKDLKTTTCGIFRTQLITHGNFANISFVNCRCRQVSVTRLCKQPYQTRIRQPGPPPSMLSSTRGRSTCSGTKTVSDASIFLRKMIHSILHYIPDCKQSLYETLNAHTLQINLSSHGQNCIAEHHLSRGAASCTGARRARPVPAPSGGTPRRRWSSRSSRRRETRAPGSGTSGSSRTWRRPS